MLDKSREAARHNSTGNSHFFDNIRDYNSDSFTQFSPGELLITCFLELPAKMSTTREDYSGWRENSVI